MLNTLLGEGAANFDKLKEKPGKKPMFSEQSLREIADLLAQEILKRENGDVSIGFADITLIERFSPARAVLIRQKLKAKETKTTEGLVTGNTEDKLLIQPAPIIPDNSENQEGLFKEAEKLDDKQIPKEERDKLIVQARQTISKLKSREQKIIGLSALAVQIYKMGDKELAAEIMNEARNMVNLQPKNYRDYLGVWMLAGAYAKSDTDKAFPILDDAIGRLNETISAFIKVGEFIDVNEEMIEGDEVQVGSFGGEITRGLLGELGASNSILQSLAITDFTKTKALTNRFDRLEVRILAKMLVLRAVLGDNKPENERVITNSKQP